jgi:hypothetical protein
MKLITHRPLPFYLATAAVLRLAGIWRSAPWYDESFTALLTRLPFDRMMQAITGDVHPPLWYCIEWILFHWWDVPAWVLRLPSVLFGVLACWLFWALLDRLHIHGIMRWGALTLMAVLPFQLWYSQEARMYTLFECLVLGAVLAILGRRWGIFVLCGIGLAYLQNFGIIFCVALAAAAVLYWPSAISRIFYAGLAILAAWAPWAPALFHQMNAIHGNYWITPVNPGGALYIIFQAFWVFGMPLAGMVPGMFVTFAMILWGTAEQAKARDGSGRIMLALGLLPLLLGYLVSVVYQPILLWRAFIGSAPFWYILAARPLVHIRTLRHGLIAAIIAVPLLAASIGCFYLTAAADKGTSSHMTAALAYIRAHWQEGDALYVTDDGPMVIWSYAAPDLPMYRLQQCQRPRGGLTDETRIALGVPVLPPGDVPAARLWVAAPISPLHPGCYVDQVETLLDAAECRKVYTVDDNEWLQSAVWLCKKP